MKTASQLLTICITTFVISSCKKEMSVENVPAVSEFRSFVENKSFQIANFYSDMPIDYNEADSVKKSETDLWRYVSGWLKDDYDAFDFNTNTVNIEQNAVKIPGNPAPVISRNIGVGTDKDGAYFDFLDYQYQPLRYRLQEMKDDHFTVFVYWHTGARLYTTFRAVKR